MLAIRLFKSDPAPGKTAIVRSRLKDKPELKPSDQFPVDVRFGTEPLSREDRGG